MCQGICDMKIQNKVFGKSQDFNTLMSGQGKRQRTES